MDSILKLIVLLLSIVFVCESQVNNVVITSKLPYNQYEPYISQPSSYNNCSGFNCVGLEQLCTADLYSSTAACTGAPNETCCQLGLECINGRCVGVLVIPGNVGDDCYPDQGCNSLDTTIQCINNKCVGHLIGQNCTSSYAPYLQPCEYGSYCWDGYCVQAITEGGRCNITVGQNGPVDQCEESSFCDQTTYTCIPRYSKPSGAACFLYDYPCESGLACIDKVCQNPSSLRLFEDCSLDKDCGNFNESSVVCTCNSLLGDNQCMPQLANPTSSICVSHIQKYQQCTKKHNCWDPLVFHADFSYSLLCAAKHCDYELINLRGCMCQKILQSRFGSCMYSDKLCGTKKFRKWQIILIVIGSILGIALVVGISACFIIKQIKRRSTYQPINSN